MQVLRTHRRMILVLAALPLLLSFMAMVYMVAMHQLEGEDRTFWKSLEWASETLTTTGYGKDAEWSHPLMVLLVVGTQFFGVFLVYMLVPLALIPYIEERFELRLPRKVPRRLHGHVVIFQWGPAVETLLEELVDADQKVVVMESEEKVAREVLHLLHARRRHYREVYLVYEPIVAEGLAASRLDSAHALIVNGTDEENATAALVALEHEFAGEVLALVDEPGRRAPLSSAGADAVFTPRHVLGAALAARASHRIQPRVGGLQQLGRNLRVAEIRVDADCGLAGQTLRQADLGATTGAVVIGQWREGVLDARVGPDTVVEPRGILIVVGRDDSLNQVSHLASGAHGIRTDGPFVVAGYGVVGQKVAQLLRDVGEPVVVVDKVVRDGVDVVGDITDPEVVEGLELVRARAVVLALDSDGASLFATLVFRAEFPDLPIIARVNRVGNIDRLHRAGADFVLSISQVSANILAHRLLRRDTVAFGTGLEILKTGAERLVDRHPSALEIRRRTGCSVVAVERGDDVITTFDADFRFDDRDRVYVCGHRKDVERFATEYAA